MIENKVKLVIWDLDDTFWQGTLLEGGITGIDRNSEIVRALSKRGIVNSICSKNDREQAKAKLIELGIWDHFVFPAISFNPKGKAIAEMIEGAALRAENVLFIDDNPSNLEEAKFFNPGIMTAHPNDVLETLLDHQHCVGKPDPELTRLKQYRFLEKKFEERTASSLSNEEFLRASNIRVTIEYDVEENFDRIVELINRTNQLNYTKIRLNTEEGIETFRKDLSSFGCVAGCVHAVDNYGDYGLIGFFQVRQKAMNRRLVHFVFSCRTMNMGIEQYVYRELDRPKIDVVGPVSYGLETHADVDWINRVSSLEATAPQTGNRKLLLLGGCDLLQLASYCSSDRLEFVNRAEDDAKVRYDDPEFILADRETIRTSETLQRIPCWNYEDAVRFDNGLAEAELAIISLWTGTRGQYFQLEEGLRIRLGKRQAARLCRQDPERFERSMRPIELDERDRLQLISKSLESIGKKISPRCRAFILGAFTSGKKGGKLGKRKIRYNETIKRFCATHPDRFQYVDLDALLSPDDLTDKVHFTRESYLKLARHIMSSLDDVNPEHTAETPALAEAAE